MKLIRNEGLNKRVKSGVHTDSSGALALSSPPVRPQHVMAHRGPAEPGCPGGERDRELAVLRGLSVISVAWALASPLPPSLFFLYHLRFGPHWPGVCLLRSLEPNQSSVSPAPGFSQRVGCLVFTTSGYLKAQVPPAAALSLSLKWSPQNSPTHLAASAF